MLAYRENNPPHQEPSAVFLIHKHAHPFPLATLSLTLLPIPSTQSLQVACRNTASPRLGLFHQPLLQVSVCLPHVLHPFPACGHTLCLSTTHPARRALAVVLLAYCFMWAPRVSPFAIPLSAHLVLPIAISRRWVRGNVIAIISYIRRVKLVTNLALLSVGFGGDRYQRPRPCSD